MSTFIKTKMIWSLILFATASVQVFGATQAEVRITSLPQLIPLTKLTVGPDDQYDAAVSPDEKWVVVTHKADLVARLRIQNIETGEIKDLTPPTADAQSAKFSLDGRIVFTYFRNQARGEICYSKAKVQFQTLSDDEITCLKRPENQRDSERSSPFWKSRYEIGYLSRDISTQKSSLNFEDITSKKITQIAHGHLWAPYMQEGGRYLLFNESSEKSYPEAEANAKVVNHRQTILLDLQTQKRRNIALDLPGLSGMSQISPTKNLFT